MTRLPIFMLLLSFVLCICICCVLAFLVSFVRGVSYCGNACTERVCAAAAADQLGLLSLHLLCLLCKVCHVVCGGGVLLTDWVFCPAPTLSLPPIPPSPIPFPIPQKQETGNIFSTQNLFQQTNPYQVILPQGKNPYFEVHLKERVGFLNREEVPFSLSIDGRTGPPVYDKA